jgi:hypothetical protein
MKKNMGSIDRTLRVLGAIAIGLLLVNGTIGGAIGIILGILAIVFLGTSALSSCPLYLPFGITTRKPG